MLAIRLGQALIPLRTHLGEYLSTGQGRLRFYPPIPMPPAVAKPSRGQHGVREMNAASRDTAANAGLWLWLGLIWRKNHHGNTPVKSCKHHGHHMSPKNASEIKLLSVLVRLAPVFENTTKTRQAEVVGKFVVDTSNNLVLAAALAFPTTPAMA